jgi:hypothetical protein
MAGTMCAAALPVDFTLTVVSAGPRAQDRRTPTNARHTNRPEQRLAPQASPTPAAPPNSSDREA